MVVGMIGMCHRSRIWRRYGGERAGLGRYGCIGVDLGRKGIGCVHFDGRWWYEWVGYDVLSVVLLVFD